MTELQNAFATAYYTITNTMLPLKLGTDIAFETCVFLLFLSLPRTSSQITVKDVVVKELTQFIFEETDHSKTDFLKVRLDLYVDIASGKIKPKGESLRFHLPDDMDTYMSVLIAYSDLIFNPKREIDYENAFPLMSGIDSLYAGDFFERFNTAFRKSVIPSVGRFVDFMEDWYSKHETKNTRNADTSQTNSTQTLYDILQISRNASPEIIKAAYLTMAKKYHPDTYTGDKVYAEKIMKSINEAYSILSIPEARQKYDNILFGRNTKEKPNNPSDVEPVKTSRNYPKNDAEKSPGLQHFKSEKAAVVIFVSCVVLFVGFAVWSMFYMNDLSNNTAETMFSNAQKSTSSTTSIPKETASPKYTTPELIPEIEPNTGYIFEGGWDDGSELTITAPYNASVVVKAKNIYGSTEICFYVQSGDTVTMDVPAEDLQIFFACGSKWYGYDDLFGEYTSYSKDNSYLDFSEYTWSYTLQPVTNGNFSETPSNKSEFME